MTPTVSGILFIISALIVYIFGVRHAVDAWQCGNEVQDWVRLAKQMACVLLLTAMFGVFSFPVTTVIVVAAISLVTFSSFAYGLDDAALNVACVLLSIGVLGRRYAPLASLGRQVKPIREAMQRYVTRYWSLGFIQKNLNNFIVFVWMTRQVRQVE